jgi:NAD(P)-dependent dehydrogenase (short-subunit alcohol dehydrogenase family)
MNNYKNCLITGAGSGIGAEIAIVLARQGYHTIITGKSLSSLEKTETKIIDQGGSCTLVELDMNDFAGIDKLGLEIFKRWKKLDILISNAAILGTLGPIHHQSNDEFIEVLNVNLVSNHRLIRSVEPLLKNSVQPKASFLSSTVANEARPFWGAYAISKASLQHMVKIWSMENQNNNLSISIINPGKTNTKMRKQAMPGENTNNLQNPKEVAEKIRDIIFSNKIYKGEVIDLIRFKLD